MSHLPLPLSPVHPLASDTALRRRLISLARLWLGNRDDAEDVVQDAYLRTPTLPEGSQAAQAWLLTVVRNLCTDLQRHQGLVQRRHCEWLAETPAADSAEAESLRADQVRAALRHVSQHLLPEDAAAVLLHEVFDFDHGDIARLAGRAEAASRQRLHRALRRLRAAAPQPPRVSVQDEEDSLLFRLCWQALQQRSAAPLIALLQPAVPTCGVRAMTSAGLAPQRAGASRIRSAVVQVQGQLMLSLRLATEASGGGDALLCLVPLGPLPDPRGEDMAVA